MKRKIFSVFVAVLISFTATAQSITGQWFGVLELPGNQQLRIVFNIEKTADGYSATMDSPDQGAKGFPCDETTFSDNGLTVKIHSIGAVYEGVLQNGSLRGTFSQMGMEFKLDLARAKNPKAEVVRPQEPKPPFPYHCEEVSFENQRDGVTLAGTLTLPSAKGKFPVVVMISGSGAQNRDEELWGHKPFLVIADYLTRGGIGVLRFDDRGTAQSTGDYSTATSEDLSYDVEAAVSYLLTRKDIDDKRIGLIGHSEGGIIAPMVAVRNSNVSYIVLLAGTGIRGDELLLLQTHAIYKASGVGEAQLAEAAKINRATYDLVLKIDDTEELKTAISPLLDAFVSNPHLTEEQRAAQKQIMIDQTTSPWMRYIIRHDPALVLERVKIPVLAINGSKDLQVPAKENLSAIAAALKQAGNENFETVELAGLNHLFQECDTGSPNEYARIEQTFSPTALKFMLDWIKEQTK